MMSKKAERVINFNATLWSTTVCAQFAQTMECVVIEIGSIVIKETGKNELNWPDARKVFEWKHFI